MTFPFQTSCLGDFPLPPLTAREYHDFGLPVPLKFNPPIQVHHKSTGCKARVDGFPISREARFPKQTCLKFDNLEL